MVIVRHAVSKPQAFPATSVTMYVPGALYLCTGSDTLLESPSPKVHVRYDAPIDTSRHEIESPLNVELNRADGRIARTFAVAIPRLLMHGGFCTSQSYR